MSSDGAPRHRLIIRRSRPRAGWVTSARTGVTREAAAPRHDAADCQRAGSRTRTTIEASMWRSSAATTRRPMSPVAPVTRIDGAVRMSGLHREGGPVGAVAIREQQEALAGCDGAGVERIAQVDEVVAGERVPVAS